MCHILKGRHVPHTKRQTCVIYKKTDMCHILKGRHLPYTKERHLSYTKRQTCVIYKKQGRSLAQAEQKVPGRRTA